MSASKPATARVGLPAELQEFLRENINSMTEEELREYNKVLDKRAKSSKSRSDEQPAARKRA
ncbi:MAG: hypothetical protein LAO06_11325 [Acidobacteriia bacterium]|nr:hypothetical protein [Terriglobia bacterium]